MSILDYRPVILVLLLPMVSNSHCIITICQYPCKQALIQNTLNSTIWQLTITIPTRAPSRNGLIPIHIKVWLSSGQAIFQFFSWCAQIRMH